MRLLRSLHCRARLLLLSMLLSPWLVPSAQAGNAQLVFYVFDSGTPVANIEVLLDGRLEVLTDAGGRAEVAATSGIHLIELKREDSLLLEQQLLVVSDEISQWIVDVTGLGSALYDVESTGPGVTGSMPTAATPDEGGVTGQLQGRLLNTDDGQPVAGARIFISGVAQHVISDSAGRFSVEVPSGSRSVSVLHAGFNTLTRDQVEIPGKGTATLDLELTPAGSELPEFVVLVPFISGSLASVLEERQQSDTISDILSAEQISRGGDSDAAGALRRVAGLTLVGDGFIYVRGLGERYSSTTLNGMTIPSPDPTRRVVPLDLFPADILESVLVQKTFSSWVPGDFGGGTIELRTRGMPEAGFFTVAAGVEYLTSTSFDDGLRYDGGGSDWTGYDNGARALPDSMCDALCDGTELVPASPFLQGGFTPSEIETFGQDLADVWDVAPKTIGPNSDISVTGGNRWDWDDFSAGFTAAGLWGQDWESREEIRRVFTATNAGLAPVDDLQRFVTFRDTAVSAFISGELSWKERHGITLTHMLLRKSEDRAQADTGISESPDQEVLLRRLQWEENQLRTTQLAGRHVLERLYEIELDWQVATSQATREEPKTRNYRYESDNTGQLALSTRAESNSLSFSDLEDNSDSYNLQLGKRFELPGTSALRVRLGAGEISRDRSSVLRRFSFKDAGPLSRNPELRRQLSLEDVLTDETIGQSGFQLRETTQATDNYSAVLEQKFSYFGLDYEWGETLQVSLGMRQEDHFQRVETFQLFNPGAPPLVGELDKQDRLPAAAITWAFRPGMQIRLGYSETVNRPDFRELAAAPYEDPLLDETLIGNPALRQAEITNYDLRWEWYPGQFQSFSIAAFYKEFTDPIEKIIQPGAFNVTTLSNAEGAENLGVEADFRVQLTPIGRVAASIPGLSRIPFGDLYFAGNVTWIDSEIRLRPQDVVTNTNASRSLEGQSPYVVNLQLGYDSPDERWAGTLLFNTFGKRIVKVGLLGAPDIFEQPVNVVDFTLSFKLDERWKFGFKAKNLLDEPFTFTQGSEVTRSYQKGRSFSLSVSHDL